jgi:hypothetical protein
METFEIAMNTLNTIVYESRADGSVDYKANMENKGAGVGTEAGYYIDSISKWGDGVVEMFSLFEECKLDYYLMSFGTSFQTLNGLLNMGTNVLFMMMPTEGIASTTNNPILTLNNASGEGCSPATFGAAFGGFLQSLFMV